MVYPFCLECRGVRDMCHQGRCELLDTVRERIPRTRPLGRLIEGPSPPDVFVGQYGYPRVGVGPLVPPTEAVSEAPVLGTVDDLVAAPIEDVVAYRSLLFHTRQSSPVRVRRTPPRILDLAREVALSTRPVDTEVELTKAPPATLAARLDPFAAPMGPGVAAERGRVVGRPIVPRKVDALVGDTDATATVAANELYGSGVGEDHILRLFSLGLLGKATTRRLVPTRWSITAVDDILSKRLAEDVRGMQELGEPRVHSSELKGNHFHVILLPRRWEFEMLEAWLRGSLWAAGDMMVGDREGYGGRSDYARNVTGAYYSARLAVLEHLSAIHRQASVVVYREVTEEYWAPLGVWVIREGVRKAMRSPASTVDSIDAAVETVTSRVRLKEWHKKAQHIKEAKAQRRLEDFA
ncbi:MAG: hypothetical protein GWN18_14595 [Thermoplasmata archaeon]|nr:hypothetical protein [Thermoplasmata archaeon]NIS13277.1 hypothetical protein [Thermoplasmata archaeon]NIS21172.1 hypothetical protein [Thermoplasmata archaeon]NIT78659.1 hypothetical protein [Thermoplasmata archaeon]NIU50230.1 hypothetical protein [Thermoplasmata archaeon]